MHQSDVNSSWPWLHGYHQYLPLLDVIIAHDPGILPLDPGAQWLQLLQLLDLLSSDLTSAMLSKNDSGRLFCRGYVNGEFVCVCV